MPVVEVVEVAPGAYGIRCPWCEMQMCGGWDRRTAEEQASWHELGCPNRGVEMIEKHEAVLAEYTDEYLTERLTHPEQGVRDRARALLSAPPEYRQGIEAEVSQLSSRIEDRNGFLALIPTGVMPGDARRMALEALAAQGVPLRRV